MTDCHGEPEREVYRVGVRCGVGRVGWTDDFDTAAEAIDAAIVLAETSGEPLTERC